MKTRLMILPAAAVVLWMVGIAEARPGGGCGPKHGGEPLQRYIDALDLDSPTREKVQEILDASKQERAGFRARIRPEFERMRNLLDQDEPDEAAVMQQVEKIGLIKIEGRKAMLGTLLRVRALLTPEQRETLMEMKRQEREKRRDRRERRWHRKGGEPQDG
jgi:Spy/CpxP family protein refolding chaperone